MKRFPVAHPIPRAAVALAAVLRSVAPAGTAEAVTLTQDGGARAVVVIQNPDDANARLAADEFVRHIRLASGATLRSIGLKELDALPADTGRVLFGAGPLTEAAGIDVGALAPEEYRIVARNNTLAFAGHDLGEVDFEKKWHNASPATLYAVCHFLDRELGVRWLWPGELGTHVPRRPTIEVGDRDVTARPEFQLRRFRTPTRRLYRGDGPKMMDEAQLARFLKEQDLWVYHHGMGGRSRYRFGHAFRDWWKKYRETRPEYFAVAPEGQRFPRPDRVKLCVSHPAVAERILEEWREAGRPNNWNVCPNDGAGFCVCERCQALDGVPHPSDMAVWRSDGVNLTGRYVDLWNRLLRAMRKENPKATLSAYAYSCYRDPLPGMKLEDGMVLGVVHSYKAYDQWKKLSDLGAKLFLRPNWFHTAACAPHIPVHWQGEFVQFCRKHNMIGFDFDSLTGAWATQGALCYVNARICARADLTVDACLDEYCSAFGPGGTAVRQYLAYWEDYAERCAYTVPVGGGASIDPEGLYERAVAEHGLSPHPLRAGWQVLPYLYGEEVLAPAERLLSEAEARIGGADEQARARVDFLRDGLAHLRLLRDTVRLAYLPEDRKRQRAAELKAACRRLQTVRREMTPRHVIWGDFLNWSEKYRGVPVTPDAVMDDLRGM